MKQIYLILSFFLFTTVYAQEATTTIYLIRHAEKANDSKDPELSAAGTARAQNWAQYFKDKPVDHFFVTQYKRTSLTVSPIAQV
jgi:broad specificity phosphatase PhoE